MPPAGENVVDLTEYEQEYNSDDDAGVPLNITSSTLTSAQKAALAAQAHPFHSPAHDEEETQPLSSSIMAGRDGSSMAPGRVLAFEQKQEALCVGLSNDGSLMAVGARNGDVMVINPENLAVMSTLSLEVPGGPSACTSLQLRPSDATSSTQNVMLVAKGEHIVHCHATSGTAMRTTTEEGNRINAVSCRADGEMFASAGSDAAVRVYDETRRAPLATLAAGGPARPDLGGHSNSIFGLAWKPEDFQVLLSGGWDGSVQVWDLRMGRSVRTLHGPYICGDALDACGSMILTGSWRHDAPLQLWDYGSGRLICNLPFHQPGPNACKLYAAKFGRGAFEGQVLAGGSGDRPVARLYSKEGAVMSTLLTQSAVHSIAWSHAQERKYMAVCCAFQIHVLDCS